MRWDFFVRVIDNHGDVGVCWRAACALARAGDAVRLWIDDPSALGWMAPQGEPGVEVLRWTDPAPLHTPGDAVVEAFGCDPPASFVAAIAEKARSQGRQPAWINLEYLSAEPYVERSHGLPSPVGQGPAAGLAKTFVYPGFTSRTGGLLREDGLAARQAAFDAGAWLRQHGIPDTGAQRTSLFCYEPPLLGALLEQLAAGPPAQLLVTEGRARAAVDAAVGPATRLGSLDVHRLPLLSQVDFDHLLWSCDFNCVRGEDSLVRALLAGKPFTWHIYPQADGAHGPKLDAFLDWLAPPPAWRAFQRAWNGLQPGPLPALDAAAWRPAAELARARAFALPDLAATLRRLAGRPATI
jgi:uncharacterized repeat protein (TIGR03837 family)